MFAFDRPIAAVLAALATAGLQVLLKLNLESLFALVRIG